LNIQSGILTKNEQNNSWFKLSSFPKRFIFSQ